MLTLNNYSVSIGNKEILHTLTLRFEKGKTYILMGPNGSGKSTLALSLAGFPGFTVEKSSKVFLSKKNLLSLSPEERSQKGLSITFQSPPPLPGITVFQLLRTALSGRVSAQTVQKMILCFSKDLRISRELLDRSLNDGFSGGERKKMEALQIAVLKPKIVFFDEIDTGVDRDALHDMISFLKKNKNTEQTSVFITHQKRLADLVSPDKVIVLKKGQVSKIGETSLAKTIEEKGYQNF